MGLVLIGPCLVFMTMYVWSRKNEDAPMGFFGQLLCSLPTPADGLCTTGFSFKGLHLPWVLMAIGILMGNDPTMDLCGIG